MQTLKRQTSAQHTTLEVEVKWGVKTERIGSVVAARQHDSSTPGQLLLSLTAVAAVAAADNTTVQSLVTVLGTVPSHESHESRLDLVVYCLFYWTARTTLSGNYLSLQFHTRPTSLATAIHDGPWAVVQLEFEFVLGIWMVAFLYCTVRASVHALAMAHPPIKKHVPRPWLFGALCANSLAQECHGATRSNWRTPKRCFP